LKSNREGGEPIYSGEDILTKINEKTVKELKEYIIMKKISTIELPSILVCVDNNDLDCLKFDLVDKTVSEISFYGSLIYRNRKINENECKCELIRFQDNGYLVRTKPKGVLLGGISIGAASIDTLSIEKS
jgi:hypothetical protein